MFKPASAPPEDLATLAVKTIKFLAVDGVERANSGHPGLPMGAADMAFVLWSRYLRHDPADPHWPDRDRFVLSAGHGSMLLYSLLHLSGYDLTLDDLKNFRQWGSRTPGHPEAHLTPGVECTTGPLGQGFANGVGMALAAKMAHATYPGLYSHRVWGIVSDGDMMEGISHEAASLAGHLKLDNLVYLYDDNKITLDASLEDSMSEDVAARFAAYGWHVQHVDGHDHIAIAAAIEAAVAQGVKPSLLLCRTHIGNGAPNKHDTHKVHGEPLGAAEMEATRKALGWPLDKTFWVPDAVRSFWRQRAAALAAEHKAWAIHQGVWLSDHPGLRETYLQTFACAAPDDLLAQLVAAAPAQTDATRSLAGTIQQKAAALVPSLVGGDADLGGSTKTPMKAYGKISATDFTGRNIRFGIREHAMGAMANGMALYGHYIPFTATFLTFSDYMRPAIRLAALTGTRVIHVFTHDSIFLGEDGPTHQSVEHAAALRLIPNVDVWRPADAVECAAAWASGIQRKDGPSEIILSRQKVAAPSSPTKPEDAARGGYVRVRETGGAPDVVFIGTGSETGVAEEAAGLLTAAGLRVRVVSMPCVEVFARQDAAYRATVLPTEGIRVSIEAGRTDGWWRWIGERGLPIGIDRFGASAPAAILAEKFGLTAPLVAARVREFIGR